MFENYDDILSVEEVCDALKISPSYAYKLLKGNILKSFKEGKNWKITKTALKDYVTKRESGLS